MLCHSLKAGLNIYEAYMVTFYSQVFLFLTQFVREMREIVEAEITKLHNFDSPSSRRYVPQLGEPSKKKKGKSWEFGLTGLTPRPLLQIRPKFERFGQF